MREIITLQLGGFSNFVGSHFWNVQDDARHPVSYDESGDPVYEEQQAHTELLYRSSGRGMQLNPRLVLCDAADAFGSLNQQGVAIHSSSDSVAPSMDPLAWGGSVQEIVQEAHATHAFVQMMGAPLLNEHGQTYCSYADEYAWNRGSINGGKEQEEEEETDDEDEDEDYSARRRSGRRASPKRGQPAVWGVPAGSQHSRSPPTSFAAEMSPMGAGDGTGGEGEGEEAMRSAVFDFEGSVESWSDYLQAQLHPRSLGQLKPHVHSYSALARFPDGACIVEQEEEAGDGPGLLERVRRFLEECDALQGFHMLLDADSGYGGAAAALLTQIRDDYSRAPCLSLGLGTLSRPQREQPEAANAHIEPTFGAEGPSVGRDGVGAHSYTPALNDAFSLTAFADLRCSYIPLYGSSALRAALGRAPPSSAERSPLGEEPEASVSLSAASVAAAAASAATAASLLGALGLGGAPHDGGLYGGTPTLRSPPLLSPQPELRYHAAALGATFLEAVTLPYRARSPAGSLNGMISALNSRGGMHLSVGVLGLPLPSTPALLAHQGWMVPLLPYQRDPASCRALEQVVSWLGHTGGGRAVAPLLPSLLPCRADGGALWVRPQRFALPLSYPQFFDRHVGVHGELVSMSSPSLCSLFTPPLPVDMYAISREVEKEVLDVQIGAAVQASSAVCPSLRRVASDWASKARAAERAAVAEGWAARDELSEITESLTTMQEAYAETDVQVGSTSVSG